MSWFDTPRGCVTLALIVVLRPAKLTCMPNIDICLLATIFVICPTMSKKATLRNFFRRKCEMELESETDSVGIKRTKIELDPDVYAGTNETH